MTDEEMDALIKSNAGGEVTYRDHIIFKLGQCHPMTEKDLKAKVVKSEN